MRNLQLVCVLVTLLSPLSVPAATVKIACIGDSITEGSGLSNPSTESYPAKLGRLLGTNYLVRNFGVSGRTLLREGDFPYWKESAFKTSHDWLPDVVIIQLGTNDGKPYNWRYGTNFVGDYQDLVASYGTLSSTPRIIMCTPCPVYGKGAYDIQPGTVATNIAPIIRQLAQDLDLELLDLQTRLAGHAELFPDTVHPNSKGTTVMTAVMYQEITKEPVLLAGPSVSFRRIGTSRLAVDWPANARSLVPQFASALRSTNTTWSVAEQAIYLNGDWASQTNTSSGLSRFYRLWQP